MSMADRRDGDEINLIRHGQLGWAPLRGGKAGDRALRDPHRVGRRHVGPYGIDIATTSSSLRGCESAAVRDDEPRPRFSRSRAALAAGGERYGRLP